MAKIRVTREELWPYYTINEYDDFGTELEVDDATLLAYKSAKEVFWMVYREVFADYPRD